MQTFYCLQHDRWRVLMRPFISFLLICSLLFSSLLFAMEPANRPLTLNRAIKQAFENNPSLKVFSFRERRAVALAQGERQTPPLALSLDLENFSGTGDFESFNRAELSLALSSVLELGGKRQARVALSNARLNKLASERALKALDLSGEVTRAYIEVLVAQAALDLANDSLQLAGEVLASVSVRVRAGASPNVEQLRAEAAQGQAHLARMQQKDRLQRARMGLSLIWGDPQPQFSRVEGSLFKLAQAGSFDNLYARAVLNPSIQFLLSEGRLRKAETRLAQTAARADISWSIGVRSYGESDDRALLASLSVPLAVSRQNRFKRQAAQAAVDEVGIQHKLAELTLHARLYEAFHQRKTAIEAVSLLQATVIPRLEKAQREMRSAYERGCYSYLEWVAAQQDLLVARHALIRTAAAAHIYQSEIEQLTAEPLFDRAVARVRRNKS